MTRFDSHKTAIPIARAFANACSIGIPTIEFAAGAISVEAATIARTEMFTWLEATIRRDSIWSRVVPDPIVTGTKIAPSAFVYLSDGVLPDANLIVPIALKSNTIASTNICNSLIDSLLERLNTLRDIEPTSVLELVILPGHSTWLHLGATLHFAKSNRDEFSGFSGAKVVAPYTFEIAPSQVADALMRKAIGLWPCRFNAVFVEFENTLRLSDVSVDEPGAQENLWRVAKEVNSLNASSDMIEFLLANAALNIPPRRRATCVPLSRGQSQGQRSTSGPLATSIREVSRFAADGNRPILAVHSLSPSDAFALNQCSGLLLEREGPASHIVILARSLGLAVVTRVEGLRVRTGVSVSFGRHVLRPGELISVIEDDGGIYRGTLPPLDSPTESIARWLERRQKSPVLVSATSNDHALPARSIGLCRSEMQILGSSVAHLFRDYLARVITTTDRKPVPDEIQKLLKNCLVELLAASQGALINYRLIDADAAEILLSHHYNAIGRDIDTDPLTGAQATVRGPRWALGSGFYDWQLGMAIAVAAEAAEQGPVDLIITLPSAFGLEEVRTVRSMFDRHLRSYPAAQSSVRFGVMLENPRLCSAPSALAAFADAYSFGLNDLTSAVYGVSRDAWSKLEPYYSATRLEEQDPFTSLDWVGVGSMVSGTIKKLSKLGIEGPFFLCGESAASPAAHKQFAGQRMLYFSVAEPDWAKTYVSCAKQNARLSGAVFFGFSPSDRCSAATLKQVVAARAIGRNDIAQEAALRWFSTVFHLQPLPHSQNWKVLKKFLVASLFGSLEGRFFPPPWSVEEVYEYILSLKHCDRSTRVSAFPNSISCHARSNIIDSDWSRTEIANFLRSFDPTTTLNVFPQQRPEQMCFRVVFDDSGIVLEAGWGQAMYVFENERGEHPTILCKARSAIELRNPVYDAPDQLSSALDSFLKNQSSWLQALYDVLPSFVGSRDLALEGYFDPVIQSRAIVDIDLPMDLAWNA